MLQGAGTSSKVLESQRYCNKNYGFMDGNAQDSIFGWEEMCQEIILKKLTEARF